MCWTISDLLRWWHYHRELWISIICRFIYLCHQINCTHKCTYRHIGMHKKICDRENLYNCFNTKYSHESHPQLSNHLDNVSYTSRFLIMLKNAQRKLRNIIFSHIMHIYSPSSVFTMISACNLSDVHLKDEPPTLYF